MFLSDHHATNCSATFYPYFIGAMKAPVTGSSTILLLGLELLGMAGYGKKGFGKKS